MNNLFYPTPLMHACIHLLINLKGFLKMKNQIDWKKFARYFAGECSDDEKKEMEDWKKTEPSNARFVDSMKKVWTESSKSPVAWDVEAAWKNFSDKAAISKDTRILPMSPPTPRFEKQQQVWGRRSSFAVAFRIAAVFALIALSGYLSLNHFGVLNGAASDSGKQEIITENGQQVKINLSDGTKVKLNAASKLRFSPESWEKSREVYLDGEAYFEVVPNPDKPFIVNTAQAKVRVLGTSFNVNAWEADKEVRVIVAEGKVAFQSNDSAFSEKTILTKNQMSSLTQGSAPSTPKTVDTDKYLAWIRNELIFDNTRLSDVMVHLKRWYNLDCQLADSTLGSRHLTASFKNESLDEILNIIVLSLDLNYTRENHNVIFSHN